MKPDEIELPAIHDWHLRETLDQLGLLDGISKGLVKCMVCGIFLTTDNIGGLVVGRQGNHKLFCDRSSCISEIKNGAV